MADDGSSLKALLALNLHSEDGTPSPNKPLWILYAIGRILSGEENPQILYEQGVSDLRDRLEGSKGNFEQAVQTNPHYGFWRLKNDGVWEVKNAQNVGESSSGDAHVTDLIEQGVTGGLTPALYAELQQSRSDAIDFAGEFSSKYLGEFEPDVIKDLFDRLGISASESIPDFLSRTLADFISNGSLRKLTGPPEHWLTTLNTGFWGLASEHGKVWSELRPGNLFVFHSTAPKWLRPAPELSSALIGVGRLESTSQKKSLEWYDELETGENTWPLLLHFDRVWWTGKVFHIADLSIEDRRDRGEKLFLQDMAALLENGLSLAELRSEGVRFPVQSSISQVSNPNRLAQLITPRLKNGSLRRAKLPALAARQRSGEVEWQDDFDDKRQPGQDRPIDPNIVPDKTDSRDEGGAKYFYAHAPAKIQAGTRKHQEALMVLRNYIVAFGVEPTENAKSYDLLADNGAEVLLVEVKSIHKENVYEQTRRAIGQLFEYEFFLPQQHPDLRPPTRIVRKVLMYSERPPDRFLHLLQSIDVKVLWATDGNLDGPPETLDWLQTFLVRQKGRD